MAKNPSNPALLALADGTVYHGTSFGATGEVSAEIVFNTAMTGYQEILTDPSYQGQAVVMTYPEIGNYGINDEDIESARPFVKGFIVKDYNHRPSNWRSKMSLGDYMSDAGIVGLTGIDTRALTRRLRIEGSMAGVIAAGDIDEAEAIEKARAIKSLEGQDMVQAVTCEAPYEWTQGTWSIKDGYAEVGKQSGALRVAALDFGIKYNILRMLVQAGCEVTVFPASTPAEAIIEYKPDGLLLSNGPGDPEGVPYAIDTVRTLINREIPTFGICLGHQITGLALGGSTKKMKFGHHGANHPVQEVATGKVAITSQNHCFMVDADSFSDNGVEVTHINLNDQSVEGLRHTELPLFSVQYHPEASPGPHEAEVLFEQFVCMMRGDSSQPTTT